MKRLAALACATVLLGGFGAIDDRARAATLPNVGYIDDALIGIDLIDYGCFLRIRSFTGRMRVGNTNYNIVGGTGDFVDFCSADPYGFGTLNGITPFGDAFTWYCSYTRTNAGFSEVAVASTLIAQCAAGGYPGTFPMTLRIASVPYVSENQCPDGEGTRYCVPGYGSYTTLSTS